MYIIYVIDFVSTLFILVKGFLKNECLIIFLTNTYLYVDVN